MREWLKNARESAGLTQAEMAENLGITESYYSFIEKGERQKKMDVTLIFKLSVFLGIPTEQIVQYESKLLGLV